MKQDPYLLAQASKLVDENYRSPERAELERLAKETVTTNLVGQVANNLVGLEGKARQASIEALRALIAHCDEKERLGLAPKLNLMFPHQEEFARFLASCPPPLAAPRFEPLGLSQLLDRPAKKWYYNQVIGPGDIATAFGPPGSAKTFGIVDMIFAGCLGKQWARRFDVVRPLNIAYCAGEGLGGLPARFAAAAQYYEVTDLSGFTFFELVPQLFATDSPHSIIRFVAEWRDRQVAGTAEPLDMLVVDTLHSAAVGADENSAQDMGKVLMLAKHAIRELGCAVLLVHHSNKAGTSERGSSALRGAMDALIEFKPALGRYVMSCEKLKDAAAWKPQTFALVENGDSAHVWWDEPQGIDAATAKQDKDVDAIMNFLRSSKGTRYQASHLAEAIGIGGSKQIFKLLPKAMKSDAHMQSGLKEPDRDASPRNPLVYWYGNNDSPTISG